MLQKGIQLILHGNINPKRHLNKSRLHSNDYGNGIFVRNLKNFLNSCRCLRSSNYNDSFYNALAIDIGSDNNLLDNDLTRFTSKKLKTSKILH